MRNSTRLVFLALAFSVCHLPRARSQEFSTESMQMAPATELRSGGILEESYAYHRQRPATYGAVGPVAPAGNAYRYGFPVETFRYGWFGAGRNYPYTVSGRTYYGHKRHHSLWRTY